MITPVSGAAPLNTTTAAPAVNATAEAKASQAAKPVQVDISKLAQKLASDGDTQAQEVSESGAEKSSETARGKA
jgi:hypothetical protein